MSGQAKEKKEEEKHPRRKMRRDLNPIDYYLDAWTCSDRTPLQTALIIVTILLGLALVALLIWALVALARPRLRPNSHASHLDVEGTMGAPRPLVERALARS
jgi:multisubunit Na+/H+ antiporter MnhC subunit